MKSVLQTVFPPIKTNKKAVNITFCTDNISQPKIFTVDSTDTDTLSGVGIVGRNNNAQDLFIFIKHHHHDLQGTTQHKWELGTDIINYNTKTSLW